MSALCALRRRAGGGGGVMHRAASASASAASSSAALRRIASSPSSCTPITPPAARFAVRCIHADSARSFSSSSFSLFPRRTIVSSSYRSSHSSSHNSSRGLSGSGGSSSRSGGGRSYSSSAGSGSGSGTGRANSLLAQLSWIAGGVGLGVAGGLVAREVERRREEGARSGSNTATKNAAASSTAAVSSDAAASDSAAVAASSSPSSAIAASDKDDDDPLARHKLPPLMVEHLRLPWFRRLWFYVRLTGRGLLLASVWVPLLLSGIVLPTETWMRAVVRTLERCGAVFIKLGQWAATRPDLFSSDVCAQLAKLQADVAPHSFEASMAQCREAFGPDLRVPSSGGAAGGEMLQLVVEEKVLGSGSMGQVHAGWILSPAPAPSAADGTPSLSPAEAAVERKEVAIKILHPGIHSRVNLDLTLLYFVARAIQAIPYSELQWVSIPDMLVQFAGFMSSHLSLQGEARNMVRFQENFASSKNIMFPSPGYPFVSDKVLVQERAHGIPLGQFLVVGEGSFARGKEGTNEELAGRNRDMRARQEKEAAARASGSASPAPAAPAGEAAGISIHTLPAHSSSPLHSELARLGLSMYLHMLISDNFVHSDLHPGNLLVAFPHRGAGNMAGEGLSATKLDQELHDKSDLKSEHVSLVVLDSGLVSELSPKNRRNFLSLFGALILRDGRLAARLMLDNAPRHSCRDPLALQEDMHAIVSALPLESLASIDLGKLLSEVMNTVRKHHVKLESEFASLIISLAIIEGIGRQLDPSLSLFHAAVPVMLRNRETRKILIETAGVKACTKLGLTLLKDEVKMFAHHLTEHRGEGK